MASKTILIDDVDGSENEVRTRRFSLDDQLYELDLSPHNSERLYDALKPFMKHARKVTESPRPAARTRAPTRNRKTEDPELAKIRTWARANGFEINARGRIPKEAVAAYAAADNTNNHVEV